MSALLFLLLLIIANGIFAMSEIAIVSARKMRLQQQAEQGDVKAQTALALANEPNQFLSTVQIGITLIGVLAGAFGEATLAASLKNWLDQIPLLEPYSRSLSLGVVVIGITYLSLVIGELVPKQIGLYYPERVARTIAPYMRLLSLATYPIVQLLSNSTKTVVRLLGIRPSAEPPVTEEEIRGLIDQGAEAGVFELAEQAMVAGVFQLNDQRVTSLMTPRPEIVWIDLKQPVGEMSRRISQSPYSRFPVCNGGLDQVSGVVRAKDLLAESLTQQPLNLQAHLQKPLFVPETLTASRVLNLFRKTGNQIALVLDEYGGTQGLVTVTDIIRAIVGELELLQSPAVQRPDGSWLMDGLLPIDEFKSFIEIGHDLDQQESGYQTLGGFVMTQLGRVPVEGDRFERGNLSFEVVDMDGRRVDKVLVTPR